MAALISGFRYEHGVPEMKLTPRAAQWPRKSGAAIMLAGALSLIQIGE